MPEVEHTPGGFTLEPAPFTERKDPTFGETLGAAFALENDVYNAFDYAMQRGKVFQPVPGFDVVTRMKQYDVDNRTNYWDQYKDSLFGIRSEEEMFDKLSRIKGWEEQRDTLTRAGVGGIVAAVGAGVVSPTAFIPFIGGARGLRAVAAGAASGLAGGVAQEIPLALNQEGRSAGESAFSIAASTVVGGLLGGAIGYFRKGEMPRVEADMASGTIPTYGGDLGARSYLEAVDAGELAKPNKVSGAAIDLIAKTSPVLRVINQDDLSTARHMMAQLSNAGLRQEGNASFIPGAIGGTIEDLVLTYNAKLVAAVDAVDTNFAKYMYDGAPPSVAVNQRATLSGMLREDKLSREEFNTEVSRALRTGDKHEIPEVQEAAQRIRTEFQDPLLKAAQEAGIFKKDVEAVGDLSYLMRDYNVPAIQAATQEFINILAEHYGKRLDAEFAARWQKFTAREGRTSTLVEDLRRPADEVAALREKFLEDLKAVDAARPQELVEVEDKIDSLRSLAAKARDEGDDARADQFLADARDMEKAAGEPLKKTRESRAELRRRLRNLTQSRAAVEQRQVAKLDKIERAEEINLNALNRAARAGYRFLNQLDTLSDEAFDAELKRLRNAFAETGAAYDRGTERLGKLLDDPETFQIANVGPERAVDLEIGRQNQRFLKMSDLSERIADAEDLGRGALREIVQGQLQEVLGEISNRMERRTLRAQRLREQAEALDPKLVTKRIEDIKAESAARRVEFIEKNRERGAEDIDLATGKASFNNYAKELATTIKDKIVGSYMRSPSVDIITEKRGPELARVLDIPSALIDKFLENDVNKVLRSQIRTLAPDIEIAKRFGTLDWGEMLAPIVDELNMKIEQLSQTIKDPEKLAKETARLNQQFANHKRDLEGVLDRVRHRWGIPDDPEGMPTRLAQTVMRLNVARFLGGTLISSVADVARPIMRYGLERVFSDGFGAMISDMKAFKANAKEIKLAGGALDAVLHSRSRALADIQDDFVYGTRVEKGIEYATNKIGIIAGFDYWSSAMKQFTGVVSIAKILDSVDTVVNQTGKKGLDEATTYLASLGFDANLTQRVWDQMLRQDGGAKVNGIWLPNTENWTDQSAVNVFRQALVREVNNAIITPGVELPLTMNKTLPARMLFQFRSFGVSSTYKTVAAGLQQQDMAMVNGIMVSLAFGAMSYYLYAMAAGGKPYETMINAGPGKWADEAIERSGVLGMISDAQRIGQRLPYVGKYTNFSGQRSSQRSGQDLMDTILGPSYNFATTSSRVLSGLEEPTQNTLHSARTLLPFQNLFYIRRLLDSIEASSGLPERRS